MAGEISSDKGEVTVTVSVKWSFYRWVQNWSDNFLLLDRHYPCIDQSNTYSLYENFADDKK